MKPISLIATLTLILTTSSGLAKSELEKLRELVTEQERQIRMLEDENMKLRSRKEAPALSSSTTLISNTPSHPAAASAPAPKTYTVVAGDNLVKIGRKTNTSAQALAKANGLKSNSIIHPGQKLKIPGTAADSAPSPSASSDFSGKTHTVQSGETFFGISRKYNIPTEALIAANPEAKPSALRPGQKLRLDVSSSPRPQPAAIPAPQPAPAPSAKPFPPVTEAKTAERSNEANTTPAASPQKQPVIRSVMIDGEMTYGQFAAKHGASPDRLNELNGLDLNAATVLAKGSELYVPAQP